MRKEQRPRPQDRPLATVRFPRREVVPSGNDDVMSPGQSEVAGPCVETSEERRIRRRRRMTFDAVADLYEATRRGYPGDAITFLVETARVGADSEVLEVGCGTGQLTRQLAPYGCDITAVDISPAMIEKAAHTVAAPNVTFVATSFEDFDGGHGMFDLVVSGTAWHWVDPDVALVKAARLLRPGGWLAVLGTGEAYDEPFAFKLKELWMGLSGTPGTRAGSEHRADRVPPGDSLFGPAVTRRYEERLAASAERINGLERTRASSLDYDADRAARYDAGLRALLEEITEVELTQHTSMTLRQVAERGPA